ncbi:dimethylarginine dimethylaminohydrolase family protein [Niallia sp. 03133]|uniref:dimethylarginine dimethylaminohydrolase family protein n=1 Tax=Niallia sp. 03133 TaxID=3458060 RepID=UPI0040446EE8
MSDKKRNVYCPSEYHPLKKVILAPPTYMTIQEPINATQQQFLDDNIDTEIAIQQHQVFVEKLKEQEIEVILLPPLKKYPEQVFTRDIGFVLGSSLFVSEMGHDIRKGEENALIEWLEKKDMPYTKFSGDKIEGGDVIIDRNTIYVGVSNRTNKQAIGHLQTLLPDFEVIAVPFTETFLHLDCVFNILSPTEALIYPGEIHNEVLKLLEERYDLIKVSTKEQATLGTNVLSIGDKKVFSLPMNYEVNKELRIRGYTVIEVDISEIIKSGGAFRCCTLPIERKEL